MMKRFLIGAAFLVAGAGSVGVSALGTANLRGSDTLFDLSNAVYAECHGPGGANPLPTPYAGGGSGTGQAAMIGTATVAISQQVAPMSRFLNTGNSLCAPPAPAVAAGISPTKYQGLVIALDGVSVVGSKRTFASPVCNGAPNTTCAAGDTTGAHHSSTTAIPITLPPVGTDTATSYTLNGWRDALRVLFAGLDNSAAATGTGAPAWAARDCNSRIRQTLANSYGNFFENNCAAPAGSSATTGTSADSSAVAPNGCTIIRHIFRRDDFSGTTDTVISLLGLPAIVLPTLALPSATGATPFCNAVRPAFVFPLPAPACLQGPDKTWDPTQRTLGSGFCNITATSPACAVPGSCSAACPTGSVCNNAVCYGPFGIVNTQCPTGQVWNPTTLVCVPSPSCAPACVLGKVCSSANTCVDPSTITPTCVPPVCCPTENAVYRATMQDNDPIRRPCVTPTPARPTVGENVCSHSKSLGLVLAMNDVPEPAPRTPADRYNATACDAGAFIGVTFPDVFDPITQRKVNCNQQLQLLCPNGDVCTNAGGCLAPTASLNPQCLAKPAGNSPGTPLFNVGVPVAQPAVAFINDGRSYNQHLYFSNLNYQAGAFSIFTMPVTGAYYRIHLTNSLDPVVDATAVPPRPRLCNFQDMTDQIGCLVEASPCSVGYAGRGAADTNANIDAVKINGQSPADLCIQGDGPPPIGGTTTVLGFTYPLSRKLYLSSLQGFGGVTDASEAQFAGCETNLAQTIGTPAGIMGPVVANGPVVDPISDVATHGFVHLPGYWNNAQPYCEDYNEQMLCGALANNPSCPSLGTATTTLANGLVFPAQNSSTCGNAILEAFEDCDPGLPLPTATCSNTCRFLF